MENRRETRSLTKSLIEPPVTDMLTDFGAMSKEDSNKSAPEPQLEPEPEEELEGEGESDNSDTDEPKTGEKKKRKPPVRKVLHPQAKELILNIINYFKLEVNGAFAFPYKKVQKRAARATGYSESTIRRVVREAKSLPKVETPEGGSTVAFPPYKTTKRSRKKAGLDSLALTRCAVRKIIHRIYVTEKTVPTMKKIHFQLVQDIGFKGTVRSAHKIVKDMGFYWKKTKPKGFVLMEKQDSRLKRIEYLRKIGKLRAEGRPIIYMAAATLAPSRGSSSCVSAVFAGSARGFVIGPLWVVGTQSELAPLVIGWVRDSVMPAIPPNTIVVLDENAFTISAEKIPTLNSDADAMRAWLTSKGIAYCPNMLRPELHQIIRKNAGRLRKCKSAVEQVLTAAGHTVLRVPPDHPDLNPAALIWADVGHAVEDRSGPSGATAPEVRALAERRLAELGPDAWVGHSAHVRAVEQQYLNNETAVDAEVERLLAANKEANNVPENVPPHHTEDPQENNINFVRNFMGGLLGIDEQRTYNG